MSAKKTWQLCALHVWRAPSKQAILELKMNLLLFGGCLMLFFGCGGRTEYFSDPDEAGGQFPSAGGAPASAGAPHAGGAPNVAGAPPFTAGVPGFGGAPSFGGVTSVAGAPHFAGAPSVAGAPHMGGAPGIAGAPNVGGAGVGGVSTGGAAGSGATSGIVEACQVIAGNSCQQCLCSTCSSQIVECFSNFGCALILACAQQTGCSGVACYNAQTCRPVIDQFGGLTGSSMKDVLSLLSCSLSSQNSCSCN